MSNTQTRPADNGVECPQRVRRAISLDARRRSAGHLHDVPGQQHHQRSWFGYAAEVERRPG